MVRKTNRLRAAENKRGEMKFIVNPLHDEEKRFQQTVETAVCLPFSVACGDGVIGGI